MYVEIRGINVQVIYFYINVEKWGICTKTGQSRKTVLQSAHYLLKNNV
jgi:hypothetical protein